MPCPPAKPIVQEGAICQRYVRGAQDFDCLTLKQLRQGWQANITQPLRQGSVAVLLPRTVTHNTARCICNGGYLAGACVAFVHADETGFIDHCNRLHGVLDEPPMPYSHSQCNRDEAPASPRKPLLPSAPGNSSDELLPPSVVAQPGSLSTP